MRRATIKGATVEDCTGGADAAYSLLDLEGTPDQLGASIASKIAEVDLTNAAPGPLTLYLTIEIDVGRPGVVPEMVTCSSCKGYGVVVVIDHLAAGHTYPPGPIECSRCKGRGEHPDATPTTR